MIVRRYQDPSKNSKEIFSSLLTFHCSVPNFKVKPSKYVIGSKVVHKLFTYSTIGGKFV